VSLPVPVGEDEGPVAVVSVPLLEPEVAVGEVVGPVESLPPVLVGEESPVELGMLIGKSVVCVGEVELEPAPPVTMGFEVFVGCEEAVVGVVELLPAVVVGVDDD